MTKYRAGTLYCPNCQLKYLGVSHTNSNLYECPRCHLYTVHNLDLDSTGLVKQATIDADNVIPFEKRVKPVV